MYLIWWFNSWNFIFLLIFFANGSNANKINERRNRLILHPPLFYIFMPEVHLQLTFYLFFINSLNPYKILITIHVFKNKRKALYKKYKLSESLSTSRKNTTVFLFIWFILLLLHSKYIWYPHISLWYMRIISDILSLLGQSQSAQDILIQIEGHLLSLDCFRNLIICIFKEISLYDSGSVGSFPFI